MKKILAIILAMVMVLALMAGCSKPAEPAPEGEGEVESTPETETEAPAYAVAMITDYGDITDQSFNQSTYEACKDYCEANGLQFSYFKPADNNTSGRVTMIEKAVDEGYNIIVMPGFAFAGAVVDCAATYPDVKFVVLDVAKGDYLEAGVGAAGETYDYNPDNWDLAKYVDLSNVYTMIYQEELCGYMAGYATVKLGYTKLGFLGGMAVPAVVRYGYGFVQGADDAAEELGIEGVTLKYAYGNQFFGDSDITAAMDTWYADGVEAVFACGGGIWASPAEAAAKEGIGGKLIGVDTDQSAIINAYGEGMTITSAMKGLYASTQDALVKIIEQDKWAELAGQIVNLGLVSGTDPEANFVQIPMETTQWADTFTQDDYVALVGKLFDGTIKVSNDVTAAPEANATYIAVENLGNIK